MNKLKLLVKNYINMECDKDARFFMDEIYLWFRNSKIFDANTFEAFEKHLKFERRWNLNHKK